MALAYRRYLSDCSGRTAADLCKYPGGSVPGYLFGGGDLPRPVRGLYRIVTISLVDTAGHSHQNAEQIENDEGADSLHVDGILEVQRYFWYLRATTKYRDLLEHCR